MIQVFGWYGHNNIGDESYKLSFPALFPSTNFNFTNKPIPGDIIVGGGDILQKSFLEQIDYSKGRKVIISASANKKTPFDLVRKFDQIFLRDYESISLLEKQGIQATYLPDIAFALTPHVDKQFIRDLFRKEDLDLYNKTIGIVINAYLISPGGDNRLSRDAFVFENMISRLAKFMDNTSASFILFPMSTGMPSDDRITNGILASRCKFWKKNLVIYDRLSVQETLNLIASCDAVISTRLHSTIFSVISGIPFVDITHHDKNKNVIRSIGLEHHSISYWDFEISKIEEKMSNKPSVCQLDILKQGVRNVRLCQ